jgi:ubiquitin-protein ligase
MLSRTRLARDIQEFYKIDYGKEGIYIHIDESDTTKIKAMLIGGEDTPYEFGFHFFDVIIPNDYPLDPPKVTYQTGDGVTRFNPNLYVNGKVCLSIIGTWTGPPWSAVFTFTTVLLSIKSMIMNESPLRNEPGYENSTPSTLQDYYDFVEHQNLKVALLTQLLQVPKGFEPFYDEMINHFNENKNKILEKIMKLKETKNNKKIKMSYAGCNLTTNYDDILNLYNTVCEKLK